MPTFRIPVDITWSDASGSPGVNVWHGRSDSADPEDDLPTIAGWLEEFYTALVEYYPTAVNIRFNGEASGVGDDVGSIFTADPWLAVGTAIDGFLPPANCALVSWRTPTGGRRGRGRTFLGPLAKGTDEGNGTPGETFRADVQAAIDDLISSSTTSLNGALGIYSRADLTFRDLTSGTIPNYFAVLRSRRD